MKIELFRDIETGLIFEAHETLNGGIAVEAFDPQDGAALDYFQAGNGEGEPRRLIAEWLHQQDEGEHPDAATADRMAADRLRTATTQDIIRHAA